MKKNDALENYYTFSTSLSAVSRQLAFAGIAVCWVFVAKSASGFVINEKLIGVLLWFVSGLFFDLIHYVYASAAWGIFHRYKESTLGLEDPDFLAPNWINWPTIVFFWGKSISVVMGYLKLSLFLLSYVSV